MGVEVIAPADETVQQKLDALEKGLIEEFCPPLNPDEVRRCCAEAMASFESAQIRSYVVVLVEHDVRQKLRRVQAARGCGPLVTARSTPSTRRRHSASTQLASAIERSLRKD